MTKVKNTNNGIDIPEIRLTRPNEMSANKNHANENPVSLILPVFVRFPTVPPMTPYHPALVKRAELEKLARFVDQMFITDWNLHRKFLERARENDQQLRIETRKTRERDAFNAHGEKVVLTYLEQRVFYFRRALDNILQQKNLNADARQQAIEMFEHLRKVTVMQAEKFKFATLKEIKQGQKDHEKYWQFRLDNLWSATGTGNPTRQKNNGEMMERVTGRIDRKEKTKITEEHWQWRRDNVFVGLPNGGMARSLTGAGETAENVTAKIHQPVIDERTSSFQTWHASGYYVTTPNDSLQHAENQGKQPEGAFAAINQPRKEKVTEGYAEAFLWKMADRTPNGGYAPLYNSGKHSETVTAEMYWPERRDISINHLDWRRNYLFKPTSNGGWKILKGNGKSVEWTAATIDLPKKEAVTEQHQDWRKDNRWGHTPNHGYARLKDVGHSIEKISFEFYEPKKEGLEQYHEQRALNNRFVETANQGWGRLKTVGAHLEPVTFAVDKVRKAEVEEFFDDRVRNNLYGPTGNDGIGRLPNIGEKMEIASHDALAPNKTLSPTDVKQFVRNQPDTSIDKGQGSPLASNGRQSEEAAASHEKKPSSAKTKPFAEFKLQLAAMEQIANQEKASPTKSSPTPEPKPANTQTPAIAEISGSKKAS